eukprot:4162670-Ditylum_brightwellii.AAC.1
MKTQLAQLCKIGHYDVSQSSQTRTEEVKATKACGSGEGVRSSTSSGGDSHSGSSGSWFSWISVNNHTGGDSSKNYSGIGGGSGSGDNSSNSNGSNSTAT